MSAAQEIGTPTGQELVAPQVSAQEAPRHVTPLVRIRAEHARDLRWYFGERDLFGVSIASGMGIMLERAELMAVCLVPCTRCGGSGETPGSGWCPKKGSYAKALEKAHREAVVTLGKRTGKPMVYCRDAAQRDQMQALLGSLLNDGSPPPTFILATDLDNELPSKDAVRCRSCLGSGMKERRRSTRGGSVTARPTGSSAEGNSDFERMVDVVGLARWGRVNRQLEDVCNESPLSRAALQIYYGPDGGSISSLWELTQAGRRFLDQIPNPQNLPPEQVMQNARNEQNETPTSERTSLFSAIARECAELWDEVCALWVRLDFEIPQDDKEEPAEAT